MAGNGIGKGVSSSFSSCWAFCVNHSGNADVGGGKYLTIIEGIIQWYSGLSANNVSTCWHSPYCCIGLAFNYPYYYHSWLIS